MDNNISLAQLSQKQVLHEQAQFERRITKIEEELESRKSNSPENSRSRYTKITNEDVPVASTPVVTEGLTVIDRLKKTRQKHQNLLNSILSKKQNRTKQKGEEKEGEEEDGRLSTLAEKME